MKKDGRNKVGKPEVLSGEEGFEMSISVCKLEGVREHGEGYPIELTWGTPQQRFVLTAWNEGHNNSTEIDLIELVAWLTLGPDDGRTSEGFFLGQR